MSIVLHLTLNPRYRRYQQLFCRHSWPQVTFGIHDGYQKSCTCIRCGKTRTIFINGQPGFAGVLPTDYYGNTFKQP